MGRMRGRVAFHLAWAVAASGAIVLDTAIRAQVDPGAWVWPFGLIAYPSAAALILVRRPRNEIGRILAVIGTTAGVSSLAGWGALRWLDSSWSPYAEALSLPGFVGVYWGLIALFYLFPTGKTLSGWSHRLFIAFTAVVLGVLPIVSVISTPEFEQGSGRANPLWVDSLPLGAALGAALMVLAVGALGGLASLIIRFRRSAGVERAQMKVFLGGAVTFVIILGGAMGFSPSSAGNAWWTLIVVGAGLVVIPAAITLAILRHRLYDIDRIISRTVSYGLVVGVMAVVFIGVVALVANLLPAESSLATISATLALAALFNPLRTRVQSRVERRFNRSRFDAQQEINSLILRLRDAHDLDEITAETLAVVTRTMQPDSLTIWVDKPA